ncbi:MAG: HlyC/CorC family transporter [Bacteriovoracaceae bacterium]|jgi:putative hemolysin|nr:HlyC/CorC family transporter [Bacteriovoracaceae bacterium]
MELVSTWEYISLAICFLSSGFYSGSEAVMMSIPVDRAKQLIESGESKGRAYKFMIESSNELLTTILVGNNIVNILAASLTTQITARFFKSDALGISVGITTLIILVFGEILPKTFARTHAEKLSTAVIRILQLNFYLLYPVVKTIVWIIRAILGENAQITGRVVTSNDIEYMVSKAEKEKTMDSKQLDLLNSILEFPTIKVKDIMIPRAKVKSIQAKDNLKDIVIVVKKDSHSRYPVCDGELDNLKGFLHVKDLVEIGNSDNFNLEKILKSPFYVYEHMKVQAVFDHMNRKKVHLAMVKDENGLIVGIITLEDIIEEIVGEIQDEHDDEEVEIQKEYAEADWEAGVVIRGDVNLRDLYTKFGIKIPLNDNYSTLAGFILDMLGNNFPKVGQIIVWEGITFELCKIEDYEIREIKVRDVDGEKHFFDKEAISEDDEQSVFEEEDLINFTKPDEANS